MGCGVECGCGLKYNIWNYNLMEGIIGMQDKERFVAVLNDVLDKANRNDKKITVEEIREAFAFVGDELGEEQFDAIYGYLVENKVRVQNYIPGKKGQDSFDEEDREESAYLAMYLEELEDIEECDDSEIGELYKDMKGGVEGASVRLIEGFLHRIVGIAKEYKGKGIGLEDLIQEGNIGLMNGVMSLCEVDHKEPKVYIEEEVRRSIMAAIEQLHYEKNIEQEAVIKVNRLSKMAKELEEELGRHPEVSEVASCMGVSEEEVKDIMRLSKESLTKKDGHNHS